MPKLCSAITGFYIVHRHSSQIQTRKDIMRVAIGDATRSQKPTLMPSNRAIRLVKDDVLCNNSDHSNSV